MTHNKFLFSLFLLLTPMFAFADGGSSRSVLFGLIAIGFVTILFAIYSVLRANAALGDLNSALVGVSKERTFSADPVTPTTGNDHYAMSTGSGDGTNSPTPEEGFTGSDYSGGLDVFDDEKGILMDHEYDGIGELNNKLPPWWVGLFWITIIFAAIYFPYYHMFSGWSAEKQYQEEMAAAKIQVDEYIKANGGAISEDNVTVLEGEADLTAGKKIFTEKCVACHLADGGGIVGPNLTDNYWIHGNTIKDVFRTVKNGGRPGKGMVAWKTELSGKEMQQVSSFILMKIHGTTPATPKDPEGDLYE